VILVDTSVWVDHFRRRNGTLIGLLERGDVRCHPFVIGELALGNLRHRDTTLDLFAHLPRCAVVSQDEALGLIDRHNLSGSGVGWVDVHLLASALLERVSLWTLDRRLATVARSLRADFTGA
jgi:predicted nucleic acid-binding protein